jgi:hypothetical protein
VWTDPALGHCPCKGGGNVWAQQLLRELRASGGAAHSAKARSVAERAGPACCAGLVWRVAGESDSEDDMSLSSEEASDDEVPENKAQVHQSACPS